MCGDRSPVCGELSYSISLSLDTVNGNREVQPRVLRDAESAPEAGGARRPGQRQGSGSPNATQKKMYKFSLICLINCSLNDNNSDIFGHIKC